MLAPMKTLFKLILWLVGVALLLLVAAHFTLRFSLNAPKFKASVTGFVERSLGRSATYERIDYSLFPFSLVVRNASLMEKDGSREFASMREFSALVDFRAKEITSLKLVEPTIRIVQNPDGSFNYSDLLPAPPPDSQPTESPAPGIGQPPPSPPPMPKPTPAEPVQPLAIRLVQIENARLEFVAKHENGDVETFRLSNVNFLLRDFAPDRPVAIGGNASIGRLSSFRFDLSGPPPAEYAANPAAWPIRIDSRLDVVDFADVQAFLPPNALPFQSLTATLSVQGTLADNLHLLLNVQTSPATETHPTALELVLDSEMSLPPAVASHLLAGTPLPENDQFQPEPCQLPPGATSLANVPALALFLHHAQATAKLAIPRLDVGQNHFSDGSASLFLRNGTLVVPDANISAYGGSIAARGNVQLLECPLAYRLEKLAATNLSIERAIAANGLDHLANLSGQLQLNASLAGCAVAQPGLRSLLADASVRVDNLQSVGSGGSLMDQVWVQLDNPLLLTLLPSINAKVAQAKLATSTVTTSRYEEATASLSLRDGVATLSEARLSLPNYRFHLAGTLRPFEDRIDLAARLVASPEETARLADGKDLSHLLPYENGGLMVPLSIRSPLHKPRVRPDLDLLLRNALAGGGIAQELAPQLDKLSDSDKKHVQEGLQILQGLGTLLSK